MGSLRRVAARSPSWPDSLVARGPAGGHRTGRPASPVGASARLSKTIRRRAALAPLFHEETEGASVGAAGEGPVEVEGGADQGQVRESLREVAQGLAARPRL